MSGQSLTPRLPLPAALPDSRISLARLALLILWERRCYVALRRKFCKLSASLPNGIDPLSVPDPDAANFRNRFRRNAASLPRGAAAAMAPQCLSDVTPSPLVITYKTPQLILSYIRYPMYYTHFPVPSVLPTSSKALISTAIRLIAAAAAAAGESPIGHRARTFKSVLPFPTPNGRTH